MITIHHLLSSQSERVIWLMEELGLPYELKTYPRDPQTLVAHPAFLEVHPLGNAPVIQDGPVTLAESLAIFTYILDLYGRGRLRIQAGQPNYVDFIYYFNYSNAGLMPMAMQTGLIVRATGASPMAEMMKTRLARHLGMVDTQLTHNAWLAGETFTAADILCHFPFATLSTFFPFDISTYPHVRAWLKRISARPMYQSAMKAAGHTRDPAQSDQ